MNLEPFTHNTIIPSRSRYQLQHFVIGQHDTKPMQWRQLLLEAQDLIFKIRMAELDVETAEIQIGRLQATGDPLDAVEVERKSVGLTLTRRLIAAARLELAWLQEIAVEVGVFSLDDIEADQEEYWRRRLSRQAELDMLSGRQGIGVGNLQSMLQAGLIVENQQCAISPGS